MTGRDEDGVPTQAKNFIEELPGAEVQALPNNDEHPPRLHVIRDRLDRATVQSLGAWMQKDAEHAGQIDDLAGYVLVAWNKDGRPAVYPRLYLSTQSHTGLHSPELSSDRSQLVDRGWHARRYRWLGAFPAILVKFQGTT